MIDISTLVVHCKEKPYDEYIGRPSIYGNPFSHKPGTLAKFKVRTQLEAVECFGDWLWQQDNLIKIIRNNLRGKVLGCWCKSKRTPNAPCHGDIVAYVANL